MLNIECEDEEKGDQIANRGEIGLIRCFTAYYIFKRGANQGQT